MSCEELKLPEHIFKPNQCGSQEGVAKLVYRFIPNFILAGACDCHDFAYMVGGCKEINDKARYFADLEFKRDMETLVWDRYKTQKMFDRFMRGFYSRVIFVYYKAVRAFGQNSFEWKESPDAWMNHLLKLEFSMSEVLRIVELERKRNGTDRS